jgi:hypothetical protein
MAHALWSMSRDNSYPLHRAAAAAINIADGIHPYTAAYKSRVSLESVEDMVSNFSSHVLTFKPDMAEVMDALNLRYRDRSAESVTEEDRVINAMEDKAKVRVVLRKENLDLSARKLAKLAASRAEKLSAAKERILERVEAEKTPPKPDFRAEYEILKARFHGEAIVAARRAQLLDEVSANARLMASEEVDSNLPSACSVLIKRFEAAYGLSPLIVVGAWDRCSSKLADAVEAMAMLTEHLDVQKPRTVLAFVDHVEVARAALNAVGQTVPRYRPSSSDDIQELEERVLKQW